MPVMDYERAQGMSGWSVEVFDGPGAWLWRAYGPRGALDGISGSYEKAQAEACRAETWLQTQYPRRGLFV